MKNIYSRFRIMLITFALGLAGVWSLTQFKLTDNSVDVFDLKNAKIINIAPKLETPRFMPTGRGCRFGGYAQGYMTNDGQKLSEGNLGCEKPSKQDKRVIQSDSERIISKIEAEDKVYFEIYQLRNEKCIVSPTVEL